MPDCKAGGPRGSAVPAPAEDGRPRPTAELGPSAPSGQEARPWEEVKGRIDSVYNGSAVDGRGLRCVIFFSGCNLRCPFCHNPETLFLPGKEVAAGETVRGVLRYRTYLKKGGVTLSGGEPFLQPDFCLALISGLHAEGLSVCAETNGQILNRDIIRAADGFLTDVKNQTSDDLSAYEAFLTACREAGKEVTLTNVLVPGVNDAPEKLDDLGRLARQFGLPLKLLPFRKLCLDKYRELGRPFAYETYREAEAEDLARARGRLGL